MQTNAYRTYTLASMMGSSKNPSGRVSALISEKEGASSIASSATTSWLSLFSWPWVMTVTDLLLGTLEIGGVDPLRSKKSTGKFVATGLGGAFLRIPVDRL